MTAYVFEHCKCYIRKVAFRYVFVNITRVCKVKLCFLSSQRALEHVNGNVLLAYIVVVVVVVIVVVVIVVVIVVVVILVIVVVIVVIVVKVVVSKVAYILIEF